MLISSNDRGLKSHVDKAADSCFPYLGRNQITQTINKLAAKQQQMQVMIPGTEPCTHHVSRASWAEIENQSASTTDVEERKSCSQPPEVDRMPSTTESSSILGATTTEIRVSKNRSVNAETDEVRLLGGFGRIDDEAAVPIERPSSRPAHKPMVKIPSGGPRPRNTLQGIHKSRGLQTHQVNRGKLTSRDSHHLQLEISRGDNVRRIPHAIGIQDDWAGPSPKRQKTGHQPSPPSSSVSPDELLDQQNPDAVSFMPSQGSSQPLSTHSFNSQGSGFHTERHGPVGRLTAHHNVERLMDSTPLSKKQTQYCKTYDQPGSPGRPTSLRPSSISNPIDISGADEVEKLDRESEAEPVHRYRGTARQPPRASNASNPKMSKSLRSSPTEQTSVYFDPPNLPAVQKHTTHVLPPARSNGWNRNGESSPRLAEQFVPTSGKRRSSEINMSSDLDELQYGTTVGKNTDAKTLSSINRPRNASPSKSSSSTLNAPSSSKEDTGLDPSNIKSSKFASVKPKVPSDARFSGPPAREKKASWAVDVVAVSLATELVAREGMALVLDDRSQSYVLKAEGRKISDIQIMPNKLRKIQWESSGTKVRFMSSKSGNEDHLVDLQLRRERDVSELVNQLGLQAGCKTVSETSDHMNKIFEKRRLEWKKNMTPAQIEKLNHDSIQRSESKGPQRDKYQMKTTGSEERKKPGPQRSLVGQLCARAGGDDVLSEKPVPNDLSRGESVTGVLEKLKPKHNEHLRRSTRTSSEYQNPYSNISNDLEDTPKAERYSRIHGLGEPWKKPLTYPEVGKKKTTVEFNDLERLDDGEFLNDNLLSFYLRFLEQTLEERRPELAKRVYFFNTYFFATLMNTHKGRKGFNYEGVQKWTRQVDLFTYDYIIVPINEATHWYLAIICNLPALDRNISLGEGDFSEPGVIDGRANQPEASSSPVTEVPEGDPMALVEDVKGPDERGTRNSFAEMSLDVEGKGVPSENIERNMAKPTWIEDDREMLDAQPYHSIPGSPRPKEVEARTENAGDDTKDLFEDLEHGIEVHTKAKKGKRKSGPPAVTRTSPDKPVIITFDSLGLTRSSTIRNLKTYLREEAKAKRGGMEFDPGQIKGITASQIPQQDNYYDCGVFLLGYVAKFLQEDPKDFIAKIIRREYDERKDWPNLRPTVLRTSIREQVQKLHEEQSLERRKERKALKGDNKEVKLDQTAKSRVTPAVPQAQVVGQEPPPERKEAVQQTLLTASAAQPATRDEALKAAVSISPYFSSIKAEASKQEDMSERRTGPKLPEPDRVSNQQAAVSRPRKDHDDKHDTRDDTIAVSNTEEPSVIMIESQSEQDGSAPKSFYDAHPNQPRVVIQEPSELPDEIQDSQPSLTSIAFADAARRASDTHEESPAKPRATVQEIPIVLVENPRPNKRKHPKEEPTKVESTARDEPAEREPDLPNWGDQGNQRGKRQKYGRKAQKGGEMSDVIHIDD